MALASDAERAWASGDGATAERLIGEIESMGELIGDAYAYHEPVVSTSRDFGDHLVKAVNAQDAVLDVDLDTGNLFAVVDDGSTWSVHISTDNGDTWAETFSFGGDPSLIGMAVVNGFVFVGYVQDTAQSQARLRRFSAATGASDVGYGFEIVYTISGGSLPDVMIDSNEDLIGNRVYYTIIDTNNRLRSAFDIPSDGKTFDEISDNGIRDASGNLDTHWDTGPDSPRRHFCYTTTGGQIRYINTNNSGWSTPRIISAYAGGQVGISAHSDVVMVAYTNGSNPPDVQYHVSYDDGANFAVGILSGTVNTDAFSADVSLRLGYGSAIVANSEAGSFDPVFLQRRATYAPGPWTSEQTLNTVDALSGGVNRIQALPTLSTGGTYAYGILFEGQNFLSQAGLYFTRTEDCSWIGDVDGDGDVELDDLLVVLANFGQVTSNGDVTGNGIVNLSDLLTVLADFGSDCTGI